MLRLVEFILWTLMPWVLDAATGFTLFTTLYGALSWGFIFSLALLRFQIQNPLLRHRVLYPLLLFSSMWFIYWMIDLFYFQAPHSENNLFSTLLVWTHSGLLTASYAIGLMLFLVICLGLFRDAELKKKSWARRRDRHFNGLASRLPSFESLVELSKSLSLVVFFSWTLGAMISLVKVIRLGSSFDFSEVKNIAIEFGHPLSFVFALSALLSVVFYVWWGFLKVSVRTKWIFSMVFNGLFLVAVSTYFFFGVHFKNHAPFEFFLR
jgi:hypothetical protein